MWKHEVHTVGKCGHKRNFTYYHGKKKPLKYIHDFCHVCYLGEDIMVPMKFNVIRYLEEVEDVGEGL